MSEAELVERCRTGEREAQRELYTRTIDPIHRLLLRMTNSEEDAFDLAQETYVRAFTRIDRFDGRSSVRTWLYRIAVNEALGFMKRAGRERAHLRNLAAGRSDRVEMAAACESRIDLDTALATLSPSDRTMLLLRYDQGLDYRTIAAVLDCPEGTVASRLNRSRRRLRVFLEKGCVEGEETGVTGHLNEGADPGPRKDSRASTS
ncbi:MAG: RNA polymerase sigma factor [Phycisphaerae bacterium]